MSVLSDKSVYGKDGSYGGTVAVGTDDGTNLYLQDSSGKKTLTQLANSLPAHNIGDHGNMGTDFAPQYYNTARLAAFIANASYGNTVGISGDVGGNTTLGAHVADAALHQRPSKFVMRVAKQGGQYATIAAALAAIPTTGPDAPSVDRWYVIEVAPGVYGESVLLDRSYVSLVGAGKRETRVSFSGAAVRVDANYVSVERLTVETTASGNETVSKPALVVGESRSCAGVYVSDCAVQAHFSAPNGRDLVKADGYNNTVRLVNCDIVPPVSRAAVLCRGSMDLWGCRVSVDTGFNATCIVATNCAVDLRDCILRGHYVFGGSGSTARMVGCITTSPGNTMLGSMGTLDWDGQGARGAFDGTAVRRIGDPGVFTQGDVVIDWSQSPGMGTPRTMVAGSTWTAGGRDLEDHNDFRFHRSVGLPGGYASGDVMAVGEATSAFNGNDINAMALYLSGANDNGAYLRWVRGAYPGGAEVGRIAIDGGVEAPAFRGSLAANYLTGTINVARMPSTVARRDVPNTFGAAQTMEFGAIIKGLNLVPTVLLANDSTVVHPVGVKDVVFALGNNSPSHTISIQMGVPTPGRFFLVFNSGVLQNAPSFTCSGEVRFTWAGGGYVTTYNGPTADHAAVIIYGESAIRWRVIQLT